jgi:hypothetical protein
VKARTIRVLSSLFFCVVVSACFTSEPDWEPDYGSVKFIAGLKAQLVTIVIEDGIDAAEAKIIAENYHAHIIQLEGAIGDITFEDPFWLAVVRFGYGGEPLRNPVKIHKRTGQVSWKDGPTIDNPKDIWLVKPIEWPDDRLPERVTEPSRNDNATMTIAY